MKKILFSITVIAAVAAVVAGVTSAFYGDTETSSGNVFTAGGVDLQVDSEIHYNGMLCVCEPTGGCAWQPEDGTQTPYYPAPDTECEGTWEETDLQDAIHKYFNLTDVKPGDWGENTISPHVMDNDAWGRFNIQNVQDLGNTCLDPETEVVTDVDCYEGTPGDNEPDGELRENLMFSVWLDQGTTPGFQNHDPDATEIIDPEEGDNIRQEEFEPLLITPGPIDAEGESYLLADALSVVYAAACAHLPEDGNNDYGTCHGIAKDGRMVGSTVYYFGIDWNLPLETGNEIQNDSLLADMVFEIAQHRNNPAPGFPQ